MNNNFNHTILIKEIKLDFSLTYPDCIVVELDAGMARAWHDPEVSFKYGFDGYPDLHVICPGGKVVWMEIKTGTGRMSESQKRFRERMRAIGNEVHEVRSLADAHKAMMGVHV